MAIFVQPIRPRYYYGGPFEDEEEICHPILAWNHRPSFFSTPSTILTTPAFIPTMAKTPDSIKNENGKFEIKCSIPGFSPDELKLDLDGDQLILSGEKKTCSSFQKVERIFSIPSGVDKKSIKCEFDPSLNQLCIEATSPKSDSLSIESKKNQNLIETNAINDEASTETTTINAESESTPPSPSEEIKSSESIKGKDYIERETDEGIEIDTTVSAS